MGEWKKIKMGQYVDIKHGFAFKGEFFTDSSTTDLLLTPGNFAIGGGFQWGKKKYYRGPISDEFVLYPGDIIVTMTDLSKEADTLGYSAIVPKSNFQLLHNQRIGKILIKSPDIDSRYLHWQMRTPGYRNEVLASASGSTVKHTSPSKILNYEFCLPSIHEQQAIAAILGSLDDKIDLNRRMNETLEAMARAVFKDWFVDFGPTRAKMEGRAPYLAQEIWDLFPDALDDEGKPVGWQVSSIGQCFNLTMGQSPPGDTYNDHEEGLPFFQGRTDFGFRYPENRKYCSSPSRIAEAEDTLVSVRAPVGDINLAWEKCCIGRGVAALRHKKGCRSFTCYSAWALQDDLKQYEHTGTVFGAINKNQFEALKVFISSQDLIVAFEALASPLDDRLRANVMESRTLAKTRDLLLPKLMSGEIRITDVEKTIEPIL